MDEFRGCYINLDASAARRTSMDRQLAAAGLAQHVRRLAALRGDGRDCAIGQGELGCLLSHRATLDGVDAARWHLVFEDDVVLPPNFAARLAVVLRAVPSDCDMVFLNQVLDCRQLAKVRGLIALKHRLARAQAGHQRHTLLQALNWYSWGSSAYLVRPGKAALVGALLDDAGPRYRWAIDVHYRKWIEGGQLRACIVFPYLVGVDAKFPTELPDRLASQEGEFFHAAVDLFTAGMDPAAIAARLGFGTPGPGVGWDAFIVGRMVQNWLARPAPAAAADPEAAQG